MGISYRILPQKGVTIVLWQGEVGMDEMLAQLQRLNKDPDWPPSKGLQITDLRDVHLNEITVEMLRQTVETMSIAPNKLAHIKMAIVARDEFRKSATFARMMDKFQTTIVVFNSLDNACDWLGLDYRDVEQVLVELRSSDNPGQR